MIPSGLVYTQALLMLPDLLAENRTMLETVCNAVSMSLAAKLRNNVTPQDCREDFVTAASMYAVAAMSEISDIGQLKEMTAGDLTLRRKDSNPAANCLRLQAEMLMVPYVKPKVAFVGV